MAQPFVFRLKNLPELTSALRRASIATGKLPSELANRAVFSISLRAQKNMPVVEADKIRGELGAYKVPVQSYSRTGKLLGKGKAMSKSFFEATGSGGVPLLALIIQARANPNYSGPWKGSSPFKGVSRQEGGARMLEEMRKILTARTGRSRGFFKVAAAVIKLAFSRYANGQPTGSISERRGKIADGVPATGKGKARATFWVAGTEPDNPKRALYKIAEPVWQEALDFEAQNLAKYAAKKEYQKTMNALGFKVT